MKERKMFDYNSPGATELKDKIVHGAFKTEGQMVAFPLCFPSVSIPIPSDESRVTALDITEDGVVYGGTSGYAAHIFVAMFHGVTGMVFDMGIAENCTQTAAVCCGQTQVFAALNGPGGGLIVTREFQETPFSLIQEWHIGRTPYTYIDSPVKGERILHAVCTSDRSMVVGTTESSLFTFDFETDKIAIIGTVEGSGKLTAVSDGTVIGRGKDKTLWCFDPGSGTLDDDFIKLPEGKWNSSIIWATDPETDLLYTADGAANLYSFSPQTGWSSILTQIPYSPVTSIAVTFDGRVFGSSGTDMQRMFCYDPDEGTLVDIGVAAS
ncbi:MAG: PQQ-like beta-propeller repeat protein, partial [Spirochaetales bacterium]|nr:PQQ-like beta-propeller repeat protein [Spirochaetales bacterium]